MIVEFERAGRFVRAWVRIDVPSATLLVVKTPSGWRPAAIHVDGDDRRVLGSGLKRGVLPDGWVAELDRLETEWSTRKEAA